jgi:hypothetical protein
MTDPYLLQWANNLVDPSWELRMHGEMLTIDANYLGEFLVHVPTAQMWSGASGSWERCS